MRRLMTASETADWLAGYRHDPSAVETDHGVLTHRPQEDTAMRTLPTPTITGVRLIRPEHDPALLYSPLNNEGLYTWAGLRYAGWDRGWVGVETPEPGDTVSMGTLDMRGCRIGDTPTHVEVPGTYWGDYVGSDVNRANYIALTRDYPDTFIEVLSAYDGHTLVLPLDRAVDEHLLTLLIGVRDEYPLIDDETHSNLVTECADEAWDQWVRMDVERALDRAGIDLFWVKGQHVRDLFYEITGEEPESARMESATSVIFPCFDSTVAEMARRLSWAAR